MKIINRYIILEFIPQFLLSLSVFTFILLMDRLFDLINLVISKNVNVLKVIELFSYSLPAILSLAVPIAFLLGSLLVLGKMAEDNEITALRASGVAQPKILYPLLIFACITSIFLVVFNQHIVPITQKQFSKVYQDILYQKPTVILEENMFTKLGNHRIFIKKINKKTNVCKGVIIYEINHDSNMLITAKRGRIDKTKYQLKFLLFDGTIRKRDPNDVKSFIQINFSNYQMNFDLKVNANKNYSKSIMSMTGKEMLEEIKKLKQSNVPHNNLAIQYHLRFSLAFACITFVLITIPFTILTSRHSKATALGISLILIFIFYVLLTFSINLAEKGIVLPSIAVWIPNLFLTGLGLVMLVKVNKR